MLAIRLQRTGRKGHAQFRLIVQDSRRTPTSGNIVAALGHYNPHTKTGVIEKDKAAFYLEHGAQPSDRVALLLKNEGVKLPTWVKLEAKKKRAIRNPDKLRRNRPPEEKIAVPAPVEEVTEVSEAVVDQPVAGGTTSESLEPAADTAKSEPPEETTKTEPAVSAEQETAAAEETKPEDVETNTVEQPGVDETSSDSIKEKTGA